MFLKFYRNKKFFFINIFPHFANFWFETVTVIVTENILPLLEGFIKMVCQWSRKWTEELLIMDNESQR